MCCARVEFGSDAWHVCICVPLSGTVLRADTVLISTFANVSMNGGYTS